MQFLDENLKLNTGGVVIITDLCSVVHLQFGIDLPAGHKLAIVGIIDPQVVVETEKDEVHGLSALDSEMCVVGGGNEPRDGYGPTLGTLSSISANEKSAWREEDGGTLTVMDWMAAWLGEDHGSRAEPYCVRPHLLFHHGTLLTDWCNEARCSSIVQHTTH